MRTKIKVTTHGCDLAYFQSLIHMFPLGEYDGNKSDTCFWFEYENMTFFLDNEYYAEWITIYKGEEE